MALFAHHLRRLATPELALLLGLAAVVAMAASLLIWPELLGVVLGRPRVD